METEELIKLVDGIYKNILDKFNPGARQMINAGKAYLKALHGAAAASRMYVDAISKLARQAQQGTWGGSSDIGVALFKIVEVYKEIQDRQMNILKAFYVDLLVPLETNLEKDTKVVQTEQKRFLQQHKQRSETYSKAAAMMKKQRKKSRGSTKTGLAMDKELKNMQVLEEEKTKLDAFCEQSLKNAMTQERRRYGFVLERQCSLSKHYLSYYSHGVEAYQENVEKWSDVAKTREYLPESVENIFSNRLRQISVWQGEDLYSNPRSPNFEEDGISISSQLRKTKSMDASCLDIRSIEDVGSPVNTLNRAKSEYNLNTSNHVDVHEPTSVRRPKSIAVPPPPTWDCQLARALYAYLSSGENQLSFHEGDLIALIGERNKGWQFGENLRTQCSGWFPLAYTEVLDDSTLSPTHRSNASGSIQSSNTPTTPNNKIFSVAESTSGNNTLETPSPRMFGDTLHLHRSSNNNAKQIRRAIGSNNIPPPSLPAPVPTPSLPELKTSIPHSQSTNFSSRANMDTISTFQSPYSTTAVKSSSSFNFSTHPAPSRSDKPSAGLPLPLHLQSKGGKIGGPVGNASLHSSNDSGFSNDPPPQPEIDYSDDDSIPGQTKLSSRRRILKNLDQELNNDMQHNQRNNRSTLNKTEHTKNVENQKKLKSLPQSRSHSNLVDNRFHMTDDPELLAKERKRLVKRTKSFWKFGKSSSDNEILEGMALWKHRDLVDIQNRKEEEEESKPEKPRRRSREKSEDSDRTINNNPKEIKASQPETKKESNEVKRNPSFYKHQKNPSVGKVPVPVSEKIEYEENYNKKPTKHNNFDSKKPQKPQKTQKPQNFEDQFYDDDGDGLMLKTLNRKNILQQYNNNSSGTDSDTESDMTSDDPYDCIFVDDQKVKRSQNEFPNVAELGKKLEKLSKSSKYFPSKENNNLLIEQEKNYKNRRSESNQLMRQEEILKYQEKNLRTFAVEIQNDENGEKETIDDDRYYSQSNLRSNNEGNREEKRSRRPVSTEKDVRSKDKRKTENRKSEIKKEKREKMQEYCDSANDELSDATERQILPRTKLAKSNSYNSQKQYNQEIDMMEYGETLQRRLKNPEYNSRFDDKSPHNGNMYGPWYDLWGLDSTGMARKT